MGSVGHRMTRSERRVNNRAIRQTLRMYSASKRARSRQPGARINFTLPLLLTMIFVALKLSGAIGWSWLRVLGPLWISGLFAVAVWLTVLHAVASRRRA